MNVDLYDFQQIALDRLQKNFGELWQKDTRPTQLLLRAPTGAGKTLISTAFLDSLQTENPFIPIIGDVAFIWITFSDELAMQSKEKFYEYFYPNLRNKLTTVEDWSDYLTSNEILFINWQKITQSKGLERLKLRRPDDSTKLKESGLYFEDVIENTKNCKREIIVIIDESHTHSDTVNSKTIIDIISPKLIFKMSATPFKNENEEKDFKAACFDGNAAIVNIDRQEVIDAGLIKEEIICQTEEDLKRYETEDIDKVMLDLAIEKRNQIKAEWEKIGKKINPLCMIQLPNDDKKLEDGGETKEDFTLKYLKQRGINQTKIATWLDNKPVKEEWRLSDDDSEIEFLIFKIAAGTGWDCPRAHVLVMFREIKSPVFHAQTLGRIVRMVCHEKELLQNYPLLSTGFLYTTYTRNQISTATVGEGKNKPKILTTKIDSSIKKNLVIQTAIHDIGNLFSNPENYKPQIENVIETSMPEKTIEEIQLPNVTPEKIEEVKSIVKQVFTYQLDNLSKSENTLDFDEQEVPELKNTSEEKIRNIVAESQTEIIKKVTQTVGEANLSNEVKVVLEEMVQEHIETQAGSREGELIIDPILKSDYISRTDYGDLGKATVFQKFFKEKMNEYFQVHGKNLQGLSDRESLESFNIDLTPEYKKKIMVGETFKAEEDYNSTDNSQTVERDISENEATHAFTLACMQLLQESHIGNIMRSWSVLKNALLQWFNNLEMETVIPFPNWYRIFVKDIDKETNSSFRNAISKIIQEYDPIRKKFLEEKRKEAEENMTKPFRIKTEISYDDTYERYTPSSKCIQEGFCLRKEYKGRDNETKFIDYLENNPEVSRWFKNPDSGKNSYCIRYYNTVETKFDGFHPDWIVMYHNGDIGIYDTKGGITGVLKSQETRDKLQALTEKIIELNNSSNKHYIGGVYELNNGIWKLYEKTEDIK